MLLHFVLKLHSKKLAVSLCGNIINIIIVNISQFHEVCKTGRLQSPYPKFNHNIVIIQKFKGKNNGRGTWKEKDFLQKFVHKGISCERLPSVQCEEILSSALVNKKEKLMPSKAVARLGQTENNNLEEMKTGLVSIVPNQTAI